MFKRLLKRTRSVGGSSAGETEARAQESPATIQNPADGGSAGGLSADDASLSRALAADDSDSGAVSQSDDE